MTFTSIETETNSYVDLAMKYTNIQIIIDLNVVLFGNNLVKPGEIMLHLTLSFGFE